jgi:hypothetical protein
MGLISFQLFGVSENQHHFDVSPSEKEEIESEN